MYHALKALGSSDYHVPIANCGYRLKFSRERQHLFEGIACAVEIDTDTSEGREYYLVTLVKIQSLRYHGGKMDQL